MKLAAVFSLVLSLVAQVALANDCPQKIRVEVGGFETLSATDEQVIEDLFKQGQSQTERAYIQAVLEVANGLTSVDETLTYSRSASLRGRYAGSNCVYRSRTGADVRLTVTQQNSYEGGRVTTSYEATLDLGRIRYQSPTGNPSSHTGLAVELRSLFREFSPSELVQFRKKSVLGFEMLVQIPLGDYGTDGFDVFAEIGHGRSVRYSIVE